MSAGAKRAGPYVFEVRVPFELGGCSLVPGDHLVLEVDHASPLVLTRRLPPSWGELAGAIAKDVVVGITEGDAPQIPTEGRDRSHLTLIRGGK